MSESVPTSLHALAAGVTVTSYTSYTWLGCRIEATAEPAAGEHLRPSLSDQLAQRLYADWYTVGSIAPPAEWSATSPWDEPDEHVSYSSQNRSRGTQLKWMIVSNDGPELVVARDGIRFRVRKDHLAAASAVAGEGEAIDILAPSERPGSFDGFYMAYSEIALDDPAPDRYYWNLTRRGRARLIHAATTILNRARCPFHVKAAHDPGTRRADSSVLYVDRSWREQFTRLLPSIWETVRSDLREAVPALTRRVAGGVGFAESPLGGESFGTERCRLIAEGVVRAFERGQPGGRHEPLHDIARVFAEHGLTLERPHLNPGSSDLPPDVLRTP